MLERFLLQLSLLYGDSEWSSSAVLVLPLLILDAPLFLLDIALLDFDSVGEAWLVKKLLLLTVDPKL